MGDGSAWTGTGFGIGLYQVPPGVDWVIVGGESGPGARPCDVGWIRDIVQQCRAASVPVFVKQLGAKPTTTRWNRDFAELRGKDLACWCGLDQPCHADVLLEWANAPGGAE